MPYLYLIKLQWSSIDNAVHLYSYRFDLVVYILVLI